MAVTLCARLSDLQLEAIVAVIRHGRDIRSRPCGFKRKSSVSAVLISPANNDEQTDAILLAWVRYGACYYPCADKYLHERALAIPSPLSCSNTPSSSFPASATFSTPCHRKPELQNRHCGCCCSQKQVRSKCQIRVHETVGMSVGGAISAANPAL